MCSDPCKGKNKGKQKCLAIYCLPLSRLRGQYKYSI
nr:MAG TPA: hypothetical protein [Bacteriophage sp.]